MRKEQRGGWEIETSSTGNETAQHSAQEQDRETVIWAARAKASVAKKVSEFKPARRNANKHSARGMGELRKSIQSDGWIGAMTTAADGEMIAGSARIETVADVFGTDAEPIVVHTDGTRPVVVVREDIPNTDDKRAQRLGLADNRIHQIDLDFDVEVLAGFDADVLGDLWTPEELSDLGQAWGDTQPPNLDDLADEYGEPGERDFWPVIKVTVSPETKAKFDALMKQLPGEDEAAKFDALISGCGGGVSPKAP